jgi:hypothetical protein
MKKLLNSSILIFIFLFTSCSSSNVGVQYGFLEPNTEISSNIGYVKIYSYNYQEKGHASDDPAYKVYKGYTIYTRSGEYIMDVKKSYIEPRLVKLDAGEYIIIAELRKNIINSFPVKIEKGNIIEINADMIEDPFTSK